MLTLPRAPHLRTHVALVTILVLLLPCTLPAQPTQDWRVQFDEHPAGMFHDILALDGGDWLVGGKTKIPGGGDTGVGWVVKLDSDGQVVWEQFLSIDNHHVEVKKVMWSADGSPVLIGIAQRTTYSWPTRIALSKIDVSTGDVLWTRVHAASEDPGSVMDASYCPADQGYAVHYRHLGPRLFRFDSEGNLLFSQNYPIGASRPWNGAITTLASGGFLLGFSKSLWHDEYRAQILVTSPFGEAVRHAASALYPKESIYDVDVDGNGRWLIVGTARLGDESPSHPRVTAVVDGQILWDRLWTETVGFLEWCEIQPDNTIRVAGEFTGDSRPSLAALSTAGDLLWSQSYGNTADQVMAVARGKEGQYGIACFRNVVNNFDPVVIQLSGE